MYNSPGYFGGYTCQLCGSWCTFGIGHICTSIQQFPSPTQSTSLADNPLFLALIRRIETLEEYIENSQRHVQNLQR